MHRCDVLWWNNGGLGDLCMMAPAIRRCAESDRRIVLYLAKSAPAFLAPLFADWEGVEVVTERPENVHCDVICCDCRADVLAERAEGLSHRQLISPLSWEGSPADWADDLVNQMGVPGPPRWNVFASALPHTRRPELLLFGAGHGPNPQAQAKAWDGWRAACGAASMPGVWLGTLEDYPPPRYRECPVCGGSIDELSCGDDGDRQWNTQACVAQCGWALSDARGYTPQIVDVMHLMAHGSLYVGIDNGLGHLAAACGLPTMTIFTATDPERYRPHTLNSLTFGRPGRVPSDADVARAVREFCAPSPSEPFLSIVIATHNEGAELLRTVESVRMKAGCPVEIIVVADGTTDGSADALPDWVHVAETVERLGVAAARSIGARMARGRVLSFWDGHQRGSLGFGRALADKALAEGCLVMGTMSHLYGDPGRRYGAGLRIDSVKARLASAYEWEEPTERYSEVGGFVTPCYALPRAVFERVGGWPPGLRGWGQTEVTLSVKLALAGVPMVLDADTRIYHLSRPQHPYSVSFREVLRNNYVMCRTCFNESFGRFWLPFMAQHVEWNEVCAVWQSEDEIHRSEFQRERALSDEQWFNRALGTTIVAACERFLAPSFKGTE